MTLKLAPSSHTGATAGTLPLASAICDPDPSSREELLRLLLAHPSVDARQTTGSLVEIDWPKIRLVFCDLGQGAGRVLAELGKRPPGVDVILTASDPKWAASAFEADALDFLIKPIKKKRLSQTIRRLLRLDWTAGAQAIESGARVFVPFERGRRLISTLEICAIQAIGNYTQVRLAGGETEVVMRPLRRWEDSLPPGDFLRIHRSTLVNTRRVRRIEMAADSDGALAEVDGLPDLLPVSRRLLPATRAALNAVRPH